MSENHRRLFIGLMSGTSVDGVDAVLLAIDRPSLLGPLPILPTTHSCPLRLETLALASVPFSDALRDAIQALQSPAAGELELAAQVSLELADCYAGATRAVLARAGCTASHIEALGAHGQTVRHRPDKGFTLQLLNAARLAESTGIAVVHDFRSADVAAGGQGAPLVPAFHAEVFGHASHPRAIVNIGGIANVSVLPATTDTSAGQVTGYDTGPGNTLLDQWHEAHQGRRFDEAGRWAAGGRVNTPLLEALLADPYFARTPPKSTGRDAFNLACLAQHLEPIQTSAAMSLPPRDVQATLAELTATTIADGCRQPGVSEVFVCGGGVFNADLVERIRARLPACSVLSTASVGVDPMAVEAAAFAWLAARRIDGLPGNLPGVTGARGGRVLGSITDPLGRLGE